MNDFLIVLICIGPMGRLQRFLCYTRVRRSAAMQKKRYNKDTLIKKIHLSLTCPEKSHDDKQYLKIKRKGEKRDKGCQDEARIRSQAPSER